MAIGIIAEGPCAPAVSDAVHATPTDRRDSRTSGEAEAAEESVARTDLNQLLDTLTEEQRAALTAHLSVLIGAQRVPERVPEKKTPEPEGPRRLITSIKLIDLHKRATGLEPATSSLGSWHSTN